MAFQAGNEWLPPPVPLMRQGTSGGDTSGIDEPPPDVPRLVMQQTSGIQPRALNLATLLPPHWKQEVQRWIHDDVPQFDVGGFVVGEKNETAILYGKSYGVLAGVPFFNYVFEYLGCTVTWFMEEQDIVDPSYAENRKVAVAEVKGPARLILLGERTALNTLSRASGIATSARNAVDKAQQQGWHGSVAGTRKTTPGFRVVEKYALLCGGAATHRLDLSQMVMLKDNHIWSTGDITSAVTLARKACGFSSKIEVEVSALADALTAAAAGADIVMLDNMDPSELKKAAKEFKVAYPHVLVEASGGITVATMHQYMSSDVDIISQGCLTQGYACIDFSLKITRAE